MLNSILEAWKKNRAHRRRLKRAPELIMRAHLLMKDKELRTLKQQLAQTRARVEALEVELYQVRQANEALVWARLAKAGVQQLEDMAALEKEADSIAAGLDLMARQGVPV